MSGTTSDRTPAAVRPAPDQGRRRRAAVGVLLVAFALAGCGGEPTKPKEKSTPQRAQVQKNKAPSPESQASSTGGESSFPTSETPRENASPAAGSGASSSTSGVIHTAETGRTADSSTDWPNWRGPGVRSAAVGALLPAVWPEQPPVAVWQAPLGSGWSSPIVVGNRLFVSDRTEAVERLLAFDAGTSAPLWERTNPVDFDPHAVGRAHGNGPKATPACAAGRVFSLGIAGWLQCVAVEDGRPIWSHNLPAEFGRHEPLPTGRANVVGEQHVLVPVGNDEGAPVPLFGYTGSPLVVDNKVILSVGGELGGTIMAFDAATGTVVWQALDENVSYSSPIAAELGGVPQVVVMTGPRVVGLRLTDGELLWSYPFQIQYDESIGTPAVSDDLVLVTGTYQPLTALRIAADGMGDGVSQTATLAWENPDLESYLSSMVVHEGHIYGMDDGGRFACVRLSDGVTQWSAGRHGFYCSPILCGDQFIGLNEKGELSAFAATPQAFSLRTRLKLADAATWTMPAVVGSRIYVRSGDGLACFDFSSR